MKQWDSNLFLFFLSNKLRKELEEKAQCLLLNLTKIQVEPFASTEQGKTFSVLTI